MNRLFDLRADANTSSSSTSSFSNMDYETAFEDSSASLYYSISNDKTLEPVDENEVIDNNTDSLFEDNFLNTDVETAKKIYPTSSPVLQHLPKTLDSIPTSFSSTPSNCTSQSLKESGDTNDSILSDFTKIVDETDVKPNESVDNVEICYDIQIDTDNMTNLVKQYRENNPESTVNNSDLGLNELTLQQMTIKTDSVDLTTKSDNKSRLPLLLKKEIENKSETIVNSSDLDFNKLTLPTIIDKIESVEVIHLPEVLQEENENKTDSNVYSTNLALSVLTSASIDAKIESVDQIHLPQLLNEEKIKSDTNAHGTNSGLCEIISPTIDAKIESVNNSNIPQFLQQKEHEIETIVYSPNSNECETLSTIGAEIQAVDKIHSSKIEDKKETNSDTNTNLDLNKLNIPSVATEIESVNQMDLPQLIQDEKENKSHSKTLKRTRQSLLPKFNIQKNERKSNYINTRRSVLTIVSETATNAPTKQRLSLTMEFRRRQMIEKPELTKVPRITRRSFLSTIVEQHEHDKKPRSVKQKSVAGNEVVPGKSENMISKNNTKTSLNMVKNNVKLVKINEEPTHILRKITPRLSEVPKKYTRKSVLPTMNTRRSVISEKILHTQNLPAGKTMSKIGNKKEPPEVKNTVLRRSLIPTTSNIPKSRSLLKPIVQVSVHSSQATTIKQKTPKKVVKQNTPSKNRRISTLKTASKPDETKFIKPTSSLLCDICQKTFRLKTTLIAHKKTHGATIVCKYCDKKFVLQNALDSHLKLNCSKIPYDERKKLSSPSRYSNKPKISSTRNSKLKSSTESVAESLTSFDTSIMLMSSNKKNTSTSKKRAYSGIFRTPSKSIPCNTCKLLFSDILSFTTHAETHSDRN